MKKIAFLLAAVLLTANASASDGSLELVWSYEPNGYVNQIIIDDLEGDGVNEIIASTKEGYLYSLGQKAKSHLNWQASLKGDMKGLAITDFDGDGKKDVLGGTDRTSDNLGVYDYLGIRRGGTILFPAVVWGLDSADMDGDGKKDFVIGSSTKSVYALASLVTGEKQIWEYETGGQVIYVSATDVDADAETDVVALSLWRENEEEGAEITLLDIRGRLKWRYEIRDSVFKSAARPIEVSDINQDTKKEVVVGTKKGALAVSSSGSLLWEHRTGNIVNSVYVEEMNGIDGPVVFVGAAPNAYALDSWGKELWAYPVQTTVYSIASADFDGDGRSEVLFGSNKYVYVVSDRGELIDSLFYSGDISGGKVAEAKNMDARAIASGDIDGDGLPEAVIGYGWEETRADTKYYYGDIRVYKLLGGSQRQEPAKEQTTSTTVKTVTQPTTAGAQKGSETTVADKPASSGDSSILLLGALVVGGLFLLMILAAVLFLLLRKKKA